MLAGTADSYDAARGQRINQLQYQEEKLRNGISPAAVAGLTALLAQLEAQQTLPSKAVSILADVSGYKHTMTCQNGVWDGYDLTNQFLDDRSTSVYGPRNHTTFEQQATLCARSTRSSTANATSTHGYTTPTTASTSVLFSNLSTSCTAAIAHANAGGTKHPDTMCQCSRTWYYKLQRHQLIWSSRAPVKFLTPECNRPSHQPHLQLDR